jgi:hypothetical protein
VTAGATDARLVLVVTVAAVTAVEAGAAAEQHLAAGPGATAVGAGHPATSASDAVAAGGFPAWAGGG